MEKEIKDVPSGTDFAIFSQIFKDNVVLPQTDGFPITSSKPNETELQQLFNQFDLDQDGVLSAEEASALNQNLIHKINTLKSALIIVDFQNDFVNGSLSIKVGPANEDPMDAVIPINTLLKRHNDFNKIVYTLDWHPENHISFFDHRNDSDREMSAQDKARELKLFDKVTFEKPALEQTLYPTHCVRDSEGAEIYPDIRNVENAVKILKGTRTFEECYSGFGLPGSESELEPILRGDGIDTLFICGLATDICVVATAADAARLGFSTAVVSDCSKGLNKDAINESYKRLGEMKVAVLDSGLVKQFLDTKKIPWPWVCKLAGIAPKDLQQNGIN